VHGVETETGALDPSIATLAEVLRARGYRTYGVYSAPYLEPHWGFGRGFEEYQAIYGADVLAASARAAEIRAQVEQAAAAGDWQRYDELKWKQVTIDKALNESSETAVTSADIAAAVTAQLERFAREGRRWFVFAHFFDAHCDYVPPPPYDRRFDPDYTGSITGKGCMKDPAIGWPAPDRPGGFVRTIGDRDLEHVVALYEGEVAWVDSHVATILGALDRLGLAAATLVIVTSDHGEEFFEHAGLGHRRTLYEEVVRVPMLLRLPGVLPAGAAVHGPVSLTDVFPTVLEILGLPADGRPGSASFLPLIQGTAEVATRSVLARLVMMFEGEVEVEAAGRVTLRQIVVQDAFRKGPIKVTRTRSWPQFPTGLAAGLEAILRSEADAQYARERLRWIDVERFPTEPEEQHSTRFADDGVRAVHADFRREYAGLLRLRSRARQGSPLPENIRRNLESLGYVDATATALFPEPDVVLPPPREG
jgi:arylsulfatase A-like enzyme